MAIRMVINRSAGIIFAALFVFSCNLRSKNEKTTKLQTETGIAADSSYLFNGVSLDGWEIINFGPQGPVYVSGGNIILGMGDGLTGIKWKGKFPEINYKVSLEAKRVSGNDFFCGMTFPVSKSPCTLIVGGWGGTVVGLSSINNMDASENETTTLMNFDNERWYKICLFVTIDSVKATIDDAEVINFKIDSKSISVRSEMELSKPFGITSWTTTAALRNIKVDLMMW